MDSAEQLAAAWAQAAADLGLGGPIEPIPGGVWIADFGSAGGTMCSLHPDKTVHDRAAAVGAYSSELSVVYLTYERGLFADTLDDWGWFGVGAPPAWYTGKPWA